MRLVIDSNRFIAGVLKGSLSRELILNRHFEFYSPDYLMAEIKKHKEYLLKKTKLTDVEFNIVLYTLLNNVTLVSYEEFRDELDTAIKIMSNIDVKDAPFLAVE
jgi:predicted nucleic acid-binding protein